jgi:hypothetical protein
LGETEAFVALVQQQFEAGGTWDMERLEAGLREALLKDGCRILEGLLNQPGALGNHQPTGDLHDYRTKRVQSLLGPFRLSRAYYQKAQGWHFPMDKVLGLTESYTPGLAKLMGHAAATDGSYEEAQHTLRMYAGVQVPASQIRRMAQAVGDDIGRWTQERTEGRCEAVPTMYVSYDGTGVPMRKEETEGRKGKGADGLSGTREVKLGCVFTSHGLDAKGNPIRDAESTTYVATFENAERFGRLILQEARLRGLGCCQRAAVLGDGAHWIWNVADINFPQAKQILDFYHACEHLTTLGSALFPDDEAKIKVKTSKWKKWLEKDRVGKIIQEATQALPHHGPRRDTAIREIEFFRNNTQRMMYRTFKTQGYFIGSGVIEGGCKTVVCKRTKQSGMSWRIYGAQHLLNIRCSILSQTYHQYWLYRRQTLQTSLRGAA